MSTPSTHATRASWVILLDGVLLLLLGIVLVGDGLHSNTWVVQLGGGLLVLAGLGVGWRLWTTTNAHSGGSAIAWFGALAPLVLGVVLLVWPKPALTAFSVTVGIVVLLWGIGSSAMALSHRPKSPWQVELIIGVIALGAGIFMLAAPQTAAFLVLVLLGIDLIVRGSDRVALGNTIRKVTAGQGVAMPPDTPSGGDQPA
jgi:uncharacterized membrane protein HdeD (DUF308 family)